MAQSGNKESGEFSIDQLARASGMTVRNIRVYQERGLIPSPERRGRKGIYSETHLSRLRIIGRLLERGYTLNNIAELMESWESGNGIEHILGLEKAVVSPWSDEHPEFVTKRELVQRFGSIFMGRTLKRAEELELIIPEGRRYRIPSPRILQAGSELAQTGIPLEDMLDVVAYLRHNVEEAAEEMVKLVERHIFSRYGQNMPPPEESEDLAQLIWRLRPLVEMAVLPEVARAMQKAADRHLGDRLAYILDNLNLPEPQDRPE